MKAGRDVVRDIVANRSFSSRTNNLIDLFGAFFSLLFFFFLIAVIIFSLPIATRGGEVGLVRKYMLVE